MGRLYERLVDWFGRDGVFKDVDSIPAGMDFRQSIHEAIERADVVLVVIGPEWLNASGLDSPRLEDASDYVRVEIETALQLDIPVIPVVVRNGTLPQESELPESIRPLAVRNALFVRPDPDFDPDFNRLIRAVERLTGTAAGLDRLPSSSQSTTPETSRTQDLPDGWSDILVDAVRSVPLLCGLMAVVVAVLVPITILLGAIRSLGELHPLQRSAVAVMPLGFVALLVNRRQVRRLEKVGREKQREALAELAQRILGRVDNPPLLTAQAVRGLAYGIEQACGCPLITDTMITEAIRSAALQLEDRYKSQALTRRLQALNALLKDIDAEARPLLSIANTDRLVAYTRSQTFVMRVLFATVVALGLVAVGVWNLEPRYGPYVAWVPGVAGQTLLLLQVVLLVSISRSIQCWRTGRPAPHAKLSRLFDFFLIASTTRNPKVDRFWNLLWGPVWESGLVIRSAFSPYTKYKFLTMHEFRLDVASDLWKRLLAVQDELDSLPAGDSALRAPLAQELVGLCRELWTVTGQDLFRQIERRGEVLATDMDNPITQFL